MHSAFKQRQLVTMITKWLFFFQFEKGDTGLRGLDGNAGVKVDTVQLYLVSLIHGPMQEWIHNSFN